ncbi:hypothetical protein HPB49_006354 [Dermacentor silvarum]|uniref:Uncharacterized protein n=1 Tax=Dermacentor silvarum TaxID=543639 RepID=A0ACB8C2E4_DERSI|nr:hypothetical protein HPB49_006354 [Dermacentor silvarum]
MKPYANAPSGSKQAIFNYNLSKSRRIVENAFGRVKARFWFILKRMECKLSNAKLAIRASCTLHNICECFRDHVDEQWIQDVYTFNEMYKQPLHNSDACIGEGEDEKCFKVRAHREVGTLPRDQRTPGNRQSGTSPQDRRTRVFRAKDCLEKYIGEHPMGPPASPPEHCLASVRKHLWSFFTEAGARASEPQNRKKSRKRKTSAGQPVVRNEVSPRDRRKAAKKKASHSHISDVTPNA